VTRFAKVAPATSESFIVRVQAEELLLLQQQSPLQESRA
jgi:hypothetical protein